MCLPYLYRESTSFTDRTTGAYPIWGRRFPATVAVGMAVTGRPPAQARACGAAAYYVARHIMQSILSPAPRRKMLEDTTTHHRRDGGLKMDWTKPLHCA